MLPHRLLKNLTERQRQAMQMRYAYGWRLQQIAWAMGTSKPSVLMLLRRAHRRAGFPIGLKGRIRPTKPRNIGIVSLLRCLRTDRGLDRS